MWIKNTDGIHSWNLMDSKQPEYLLPKLLPNINQYISVITIASEIINQKNVLHPQSHGIRNNPTHCYTSHGQKQYQKNTYI